MRLTLFFVLLLMPSQRITARDLLAPPLKIDGAKIAIEADAKQFAFRHYVEKMKLNLLANETVREVSIIKLGYAVEGFGAKGDSIWEARVLTVENELRGIMWIHPSSEKIHFLTGAWEEPREENGELSKRKQD